MYLIKESELTTIAGGGAVDAFRQACNELHSIFGNAAYGMTVSVNRGIDTGINLSANASFAARIKQAIGLSGGAEISGSGSTTITGQCAPETGDQSADDEEKAEDNQ